MKRLIEYQILDVSNISFKDNSRRIQSRSIMYVFVERVLLRYARSCAIAVMLFKWQVFTLGISECAQRITLWHFLFSEIPPAIMQGYYTQSTQQCVCNSNEMYQKRSYPCHKCGHVFTRKNNLYNHLKFQCGQLPRFNCPYCAYRTKHSSNVRSHIRRLHPGQRIYVLDVCNKHDNQSKWIVTKLGER